MRPRLLALVALILILAASLPALTAAQAAPGIVVTHVAVDTSSFKADFTPVDGAKDYRIYDTANPDSVKYAGTKRASTPGTFRFRTVNNDGIHPIYPLELESYTPASGNAGPTLAVIDNTVPLPEIEENGVAGAHTYVIQAVDALGPAVLANTYDPTTLAPAAPGGFLGSDAGKTADGKVSTNGQGDPADRPNVVAQSAPFAVTVDGSVAALPSGPDAAGVFFDTFPDAEDATVKETGSTEHDPQQPAGGGVKTYTMGLPGGPQWAIRYEAADFALSKPFVMAHHFMDVLFDEYPGASWATMAMTPQATPDISNGGMLHMTMEVDSTLDSAGRRWVGFNVSPSASPITDHVQPNYGNAAGERINTANEGIFFEIRSSNVQLHEYDGQTTPAQNVTVQRAQHFPDNGIGFDNRSRFDLYMTQTHAVILEDGAPILDTDLPTPVAWTTLTTNFAHYFYHSSAEAVEEPYTAPWDSFILKIFPQSDERHWDNMGLETLPASAVPADWSTIPGLVARSQPAGIVPCPARWTCDDIGQTPGIPSRIAAPAPGALTLHAGAVLPPVSIPDEQYLVSQSLDGDGSVQARLADRANLSYWGFTGQAGVEIRQDTGLTSPYYAVGVGGDGHVRVTWRGAAGAASGTTEVPTGATLPVWLRATRSGDTLTAQTSGDGTTWQDVPESAQTVALGATALAGVDDWEATSDNAALPAVQGTASFDGVAVRAAPATPGSTASGTASGTASSATGATTATDSTASTTETAATSTATTTSTTTAVGPATVTQTVTQTITSTVTVTQAASTSFSLACTRSGAALSCTGG